MIVKKKDDAKFTGIEWTEENLTLTGFHLIFEEKDEFLDPSAAIVTAIYHAMMKHVQNGRCKFTDNISIINNETVH